MSAVDIFTHESRTVDMLLREAAIINYSITMCRVVHIHVHVAGNSHGRHDCIHAPLVYVQWGDRSTPPPSYPN